MVHLLKLLMEENKQSKQANKQREYEIRLFIYHFSQPHLFPLSFSLLIFPSPIGRGVREPARCGGSLRCSDWRGEGRRGVRDEVRFLASAIISILYKQRFS